MAERRAVGIWLRVSTEDQVKGESPERHEFRARAYAEAKGWDVATVYRLDAVSGKSVRDHPECVRMLGDLESGRISALIFSKLARLARNTRQLLDFAELFEKRGAHLVSLQESIDTSTPAGRLFYTVIAALAQWEREETGSRVSASAQVRAKQGRAVGGAPPFGYRWDEGKRPVLDPQEAPVRKLMFDLFLETRRLKAVARILNERGYRTRKGRLFSDRTIKRLLQDPIGKGQRRSYYTENHPEKPGWVRRKPAEEWVWSEAPAVVSVAVWEECNAILEGRKTGPLTTKRVRNLFVSLAYCECGGRMYVPSNAAKYICPECRNKIPAEDLEAIFREQLQGYFLSPEDVTQLLEQADETLRERQALLAALEAEEASVSADLDKVMALYLAGEIRKEGFGERYQPLEDRRNQLRAQIPQLQGEVDSLRIGRLSSDEFVREAQDLYGRWSDLTQEEKRRIIEEITERITVGKGEVAIALALWPFRASELVAIGQRNAPCAGRAGVRGSARRSRRWPAAGGPGAGAPR